MQDLQRQTIALLVGSEELADTYVEDSGDIYMARGHFAPKADFMFTTWQVCTIVISPGLTTIHMSSQGFYIDKSLFLTRD